VIKTIKTELPERVEHDSLENYRRKYPGGDKSDHTFPHVIETLAKTIPDSLAFAQGDRRVTWKEFNGEVNRFADALLDLGIKKGERVALMAFNSIEWNEVTEAIFKVGGVFVNVNPRQGRRETLHVLKDSDSVAIVFDDEYIDAINEMRGELPLIKHFIVNRRTGKEIPGDMLDYEELKKKYPTTKPKLDWRVTNEDICMIYYTGGTTGLPKGTVWDNENQIGNNIKKLGAGHFGTLAAELGKLPRETYETIGRLVPIPGLGPILGRIVDTRLVRRILNSGITADMVLLVAKASMGKPFVYKLIGSLGKLLGYPVAKYLCLSQQFHGGGWSPTRVLYQGAGLPVYFITKAHPFDAREALELIEREKINVVTIAGNPFAVPLLKEMEERHYDLSSLLLIISPGAIFTGDVKERLMKNIPSAMLLDAIGTTEDLAAAGSVHTFADEKWGTTAPVVQDIEKKPGYRWQQPSGVFNKEGKRVKTGEVGELVFGGYMCSGYWKMPKKTAETFRVIDGERYIFVGDDATVDEEGRVHFIGRSGTMINTGGENVYCEEVEDAIHENPKVEESVVVGVPDEMYGEAVTALVELRKGETATEEEIRDSLRGKIGGFKIPKHMIFVDRIDKLDVSDAGKTVRREWRKIAMEKLGIKE